MEVSLKKFLESEVLRGTKIIAGNNGQDNIVKSINVLDTPDGYKYMQDGTFCITNIYSWLEIENKQELLMMKLKERGIAAIGVVLRHYNGVLPEAMRNLADKIGLPICSLSSELAAYSDLIEFFNNNIYVAALDKFMSQDYIREAFLYCYKGDMLSCVAKNLNHLLGREIYVKFGDKKYHIGGKKNLNLFLENMDLWQHEATIYKETKEAGTAYKAYDCSLSVENEEYIWTSFEFSENDKLNNFVWIMGKAENLNSNDIYIISQALKVIDFEIKRKAHDRDRMQEDFLKKLIRADFKKYEDAVLKAREIGYKLSKYSAVLLLKGDIKYEDFPYIRDAIARIYGNEIYEKRFIFGNYDNNFAIIIPEAEKSSEQSSRLVDEILKLASINQYLNAGLGDFHEFSELDKSLSEAREALSWAKLQDNKKLIAYDELGIIQLVSKTDSIEKIRKFVNKYLSEVKEYDSLNNTELLKTLSVLADNDWNRTITAKDLYVHQNTVKYRMQILEKILNSDFSKKSNRLNIEIAVKLNEFFRIL